MRTYSQADSEKNESQKRFLEYEDFKATYCSFKQSFKPGKFNSHLPTVYMIDVGDFASDNIDGGDRC